MARVALSRPHAEMSPKVVSIAKALQLHTDYVFQVHCPVEDIIFEYLRERRPILGAAIDDLMIDHGKSNSWLLAIRGMCCSNGAIVRGEEKRFVILALNYCTHKLAHMDKENHKLFPAAEAIFCVDDWQRIESAVDLILMNLDSPPDL